MSTSEFRTRIGENTQSIDSNEIAIVDLDARVTALEP